MSYVSLILFQYGSLYLLCVIQCGCFLVFHSILFCQIQFSVKPIIDSLNFFIFHFYRFHLTHSYGFWFFGEVLHIVSYFLDYINHSYVKVSI